VIEIKKSGTRGRTKTDWLDSRHSFSFGDYYNPKNIHWGPLRVMNEDLVAPGSGFPTHPHRDMEIITIVLAGSVAHKDSTGGEGRIAVNEIQRMTAGSGIYHSEFNPSDEEMLRLLQIWIIPDKTGLTPSYEQKTIRKEGEKNMLLKIASGKVEERSVFINQDADLYFSEIDPGKETGLSVKGKRCVYLHVIDGKVNFDGVTLETGDGAEILHVENINVAAAEPSKILIFDLPVEF
jgi:quercetin 2,3-dioxygenase